MPGPRATGPTRRGAGRGALEWVLLALRRALRVQASTPSDFDKALEQVVFFYVPFALLSRCSSGRVDAATGRVLPRRLVALAIAFVGIGFWEYARRQLLLNPKVINANQFESYFRVNSLFFDPNIYGRFLAIVMLGGRRGDAVTPRTRRVVGARCCSRCCGRASC